MVGENDSGKSSLIDAVRCCLGSTTSDRFYLSETDFHNDADFITIQLKFSDVTPDAHRFVEHLTHEPIGDGKTKPVLFVQLSASKTGTERRGYPYIKTDIRSGQNGDGLVIETEIREFLASTYLKPLRDAAAELSSGRASRLSQILSSSKGIRDDIDNILTIMAEANNQLLAENGALENAAKNIQGNYLHELIFESDKNDLGAFIDIVGLESSQIVSLPSHNKLQHLRGVLEGLSLKLTLDNRMHGLGYQNLLFMAAELLLLEQEAKSDFPLLLIEEPEAHLHPQLQLKLLQFISSKVKTERNPNGIQCLLTTHSPNISSKADPAEIILLGAGQAWSLKPGETLLANDDYIYLRKFLDATKASVFFAKGLLFVEGDAENILIPTLARLLERPLENYGISVIKYDNSGSWKRFARLFIRGGQDGSSGEWLPTKVCVLRDLDLWPDCAEDLADNPDNPYGFKEYKPRNQSFWCRNCTDVEQRKTDLKDGLERQNIRIKISDHWTFEYSLAMSGLFQECYQALHGSLEGIDEILDSDEQRATYIQANVSKTDFAYEFAKLLEAQLDEKIQSVVGGEDETPDQRVQRTNAARTEFSIELRSKLPTYILEAIDYLTTSNDADEADVLNNA